MTDRENINRQIATIDGYTNIQMTQINGLQGDRGDEKYVYIPDYCAPENYHELLRVAVEMESDNIEIEWLAGDPHSTQTPISPSHW